MQSYSKIFNKIIFILFLISAISYIFYFKAYFFENSLGASIETNVTSFVKSYKENVWKKHPEAVNVIKDGELKDWRGTPDFIQFAIESYNFFSHLNFIKVNLYNPADKKFLSTNSIEVEDISSLYGASTQNLIKSFGLNSLGNYLNSLMFTTHNESLIVAVKNGKPVSRILPVASYQKDGSSHSANVARVLVPILNIDNGKLEGVIEVYYDLTPDWQLFNNFELVAISGIIMIFALFMILMFYNEIKTQALIEKQHEANLELAESKTKAEAESVAKSQFLANISHELRTPLNAIIGFSEIIKTEAKGPIGVPEYLAYIIDINNSGSHLLSLINDILDYSKAEADKLVVDKVEIDVRKMVATSLRLVQPRAETAKVELKEELPQGNVVLITDPKRLKQVLLNLLSNSVKFTPEGGSVTLSLTTSDTELFLQVKDTGIGIAAQDISKAMASFGQVDSKLSRKYEGTGLGLPLSKKLVELMGGKFLLESELGFGTTVTITFAYDPALSVI